MKALMMSMRLAASYRRRVPHSPGERWARARVCATCSR
jgi:hypothetical protein